jgi:hypothetical protein
MKFKSNCKYIVEIVDDAKAQILHEPYKFELYGVDNIIPKGFKFDGASIPGWLHSIFPKRGKHSIAALLHDYAYATHTMNGEPCSKSFADQVFFDVMEACGVRWRKSPMVWAVRWFGKSSWRKDNKDEKNA